RSSRVSSACKRLVLLPFLPSLLIPRQSSLLLVSSRRVVRPVSQLDGHAPLPSSSSLSLLHCFFRLPRYFPSRRPDLPISGGGRQPPSLVNLLSPHRASTPHSSFPFHIAQSL